MKSTYPWLAFALAIGFVAFSGCGGGSDAGDGSAAGTSNAGAGGGSAGKSSSQGGSVSSGAGESNSAGESSAVECSPDDCGPQLGLPNYICEDGTTGGPTGRCVKTGDACGWEVRECPPGGEGGASSQGGQGNVAGAPSNATSCGDKACTAAQYCFQSVGGPAGSEPSYDCMPLGDCQDCECLNLVGCQCSGTGSAIKVFCAAP